MEYNGNVGHSEIVGFYSDGDGDFRPKFKFNIPFDKVDANRKIKCNGKVIDIYDAG